MSELLRVLREQTRPTRKHATRQHPWFRRAERVPLRRLPAAASPRRKHRQHRPPWRVWAALLRLTHAHPPGTSSAYRHQHAAGLLPEAGRGVHPDVTAGRRARFPLLSVRHDAARFLRHQLRRERAAAPQTPERAADTVMPSKTGGRITLCPPEWKRGILYTIIKK